MKKEIIMLIICIFLQALKLEPTVLAPGEKFTLLKLGKSSTVKGTAFLVIHTNITSINITLNSYDGKLHPVSKISETVSFFPPRSPPGNTDVCYTFIIL